MPAPRRHTSTTGTRRKYRLSSDPTFGIARVVAGPVEKKKKKRDVHPVYSNRAVCVQTTLRWPACTTHHRRPFVRSFVSISPVGTRVRRRRRVRSLPRHRDDDDRSRTQRGAWGQRADGGARVCTSKNEKKNSTRNRVLKNIIITSYVTYWVVVSLDRSSLGVTFATRSLSSVPRGTALNIQTPAIVGPQRFSSHHAAGVRTLRIFTRRPVVRPVATHRN